MIRSIRFRIAATVFTIVMSLLLAGAAFVLDRLEKAQRDEVDTLLSTELERVSILRTSPQLQPLLDATSELHTKWSELFVELTGAAGTRVAATSNVPAGGIPSGALGEIDEVKGVRFWEAIHPASRKRHIRIRVAETHVDGDRIRVASSMKRNQKTYWRFREQMAYGLLAIALLTALAAWWVATRALAPVGHIADTAQALGRSLEGALPRTESGDELDQLAVVLNDLLGRLRDETDHIRRITSDVGHALRTPLTAVRASLELQARDAREPGDEAVAGLIDEVDRLISLVNQLLLLERVEAGAASPEDAPVVDLMELASDVAYSLDVVAHERGITLESRGDPVCVRAEERDLRHVLVNLIENSLRHTPKGGRIDLEVRQAAERAEVSIRDSGPGLRPEQLERVFERFYSEPGDGRARSGLGLPIARAIARAYGGEIRAHAGPGGRFVVELPAVEPVGPAD